jgi:hypothetical protein
MAVYYYFLPAQKNRPNSRLLGTISNLQSLLGFTVENVQLVSIHV